MSEDGPPRGIAAIYELIAAADYRSAAAASYRFALNSPTLTTWGSLALRALSLFIVLPLLLRNLPAAEIALWYVFASGTTLLLLFMPPVTMTFSRVVAFASQGTAISELRDLGAPAVRSGTPDRETLAAVWSTMQRFYTRAACVAPILMGVAGTIAVKRPVSLLADTTSGWIAWMILIAGCTTLVFGEVYAAWLQGVDRIAQMKRWEIAMSLGSIVSCAVALSAGGGLLHIIALTQIWLGATVLVNRALCKRLRALNPYELPPSAPTGEVVATVTPSVWRSAAGSFMAAGTLQVGNLAYAQVAGPVELASYLLAFNLMSNIRQVANAPFYSNIPRLTRLRATGDLDAQKRLALRAMTLVYWSFILGFAAVGFAGPRLLALIGSNTPFVSIQLWVLLGAAFFVERYGALHLHLYSTTNHIIWHMAAGVSGVLFIVAATALYPVMGVSAIPAGLGLSYLAFYAWYAPWHSYRALSTTFWRFDARVVLPSLFAFLAIAAVLRLRA